MPVRPFIIDCDTGRDDALTVWVAAKASLPLAAVVASYGNVALAHVADNTARVLSLAGLDSTPLLAGLERPRRSHKLFAPVVEARQRTSGNGLCNLDLPRSARAMPAPLTPEQMARALRDLARQHGALDYFITGPASTFAAAAAALGADLKQTIARVTMLGGKFNPLWTEVPGADFNIASDPYAVDEIMHLGLPLRFVPLNSTWPIYMDVPELEALRPMTPIAEWAQKLMIAHARYFASEPVFRFHDPSVMMAAQMPQHFIDKKLALIGDESATDFGRLVEKADGVTCQIYQTDAATQASFKKSILHWLGFEGF
jgi:purine nucleosidase